jgi:RNA polymerase sigma-70 factor (ECF subfamily)
MAQEHSDAESIRRSAGEPGAFEAVFERRFDAVHNFLRRRVGGDLADELAAETFARAFAQRTRFLPRHDSALPWLLGIASNLVGDHRRAERRRWRALERAAAEPGAPGLPTIADAQLDAVLAGAVARLQVRDRDALLLVAWGELSYEEVAEALAIPLGTVRSRINRARRQLSEQLGAPSSVPTATGESHA